MKVSGITILLVGTAAIGANAQVLKGTSSSSSPRLRKNVMKEADHRRLQTPSPRTDITCLFPSGADGYGAGCRQEAGPVDCSGGGVCSSQNGYQTCYQPPNSLVSTCVCIIPVTYDYETSTGGPCTHDYGVSGTRPCCYVGKYI